jgi:LPS export ABC transporter protein LptC
MSPRRIAKALALFGSVTLVAILIVTVWVVKHRPSGHKLEVAAGLLPTSLLHAHNFHWTQMKGETNQWVLVAKDASYSKDNSSVILKEATVSMTTEDGKQVKLTAPTATLTVDGNHVKRAQLGGGIVVVYGEYTVTTDQADFTPDDNRLQAPGLVRIVGHGLTVTGVGMKGNPKTETFELLKEVSTQIVPKPKGTEAKVS